VKLLSESGEDIGQLLDISQGGISLRYFADDQELQKYSQLDIVLSGVSFSIDNIAFEIVSDIKMTDGSFSRLSDLRRYGIKFDKLTSDQQSKLKYFLQNHTMLNDS
jgi:c-di-GMP-binding flagellar brake protein YcgR